MLADKPADPRGPYRDVRVLTVVPGDLSAEPPFMVELDLDVAQVFADSATVNSVLRPLASLIRSEAAARVPKAANQEGSVSSLD